MSQVTLSIPCFGEIVEGRNFDIFAIWSYQLRWGTDCGIAERTLMHHLPLSIPSVREIIESRKLVITRVLGDALGI
jgi:hypothetical protein